MCALFARPMITVPFLALNTVALHPFLSWPPQIVDFLFSAVTLHKKLCSSPFPNALSLKIPVPSNLNIAVWRNILHSYHDSALVDFLDFGWPINYVADSLPHPVNRNHPSAIKHASAIRKFISNEDNLRATAGPFQSNPLDCQLMISPLLTIPTKTQSIVVSSWILATHPTVQ